MKSLYLGQYFSSFQCDHSRSFYVDFQHKTVEFSFCQLLSFRQKVRNIDIESHFNGINNSGIEIIMLCNRQHLFVFNTMEIIDLKNLIDGSFAMMELNSLLSPSL